MKLLKAYKTKIGEIIDQAEFDINRAMDILNGDDLPAGDRILLTTKIYNKKDYVKTLHGYMPTPLVLRE